VLEVKGYRFSDFTITEGFSSPYKRSRDLDVACDLGHSGFWPVLYFLFSIRFLTFNPRAKFEVCTFTRSRVIKRFQNTKSRSRKLGNAPFWPVFHFFGLICFTINPHAKFEIYNFSRSRDIRGSQNLKSRSHDQGHASFWPLFTALHVMQTQYCDENSVCLSVCPSVCLSHACIVTKR